MLRRLGECERPKRGDLQLHRGSLCSVVQKVHADGTMTLLRVWPAGLRISFPCRTRHSETWENTWREIYRWEEE